MLDLASETGTNKLCEVFNLFGPSYEQAFGSRMPRMHRKAFADMRSCRTVARGLIERVCDGCGEVHLSFGACRSRACPRCNGLKNHEWIESLCDRFPDLHYYHLVFTVPEELRYIARKNQQVFYSTLFSSVHNTLRTFSSGSTWMDGTTGYMAVLHTWDSQLNIHPHVHVLFMGGYLDGDGSFVEIPGSKVFPNEAMSSRFKTVMLKELRSQLGEKIPSDIWKLKWIVYTKRVETGDSHAIEYLGSYVKRTAISASRIRSIDEEGVAFAYRHHVDRHTCEQREMRLGGMEFIRRYMQHVLPAHFVKVRYYGLLHPFNRSRLEEIKVRYGAIKLRRHQAHQLRQQCEACHKPYRISMLILPTYALRRNDLRGKSGGKFYNGNPAPNQGCRSDPEAVRGSPWEPPHHFAGVQQEDATENRHC